MVWTEVRQQSLQKAANIVIGNQLQVIQKEGDRVFRKRYSLEQIGRQTLCRAGRVLVRICDVARQKLRQRDLYCSGQGMQEAPQIIVTTVHLEPGRSDAARLIPKAKLLHQRRLAETRRRTD